jgi:hypothetical protein
MAMLSLQGVNEIFDDLQGELVNLKKLTKASERDAALMNLREKFVSAREVAHASHSELLEKVDALEKELVGFRNWEREKQRYQLQQLPPTVWVYALKPEMANGEPPHQICPVCYQRGQKSLLHGDEPGNGIHHLRCGECKATLTIGHYRAPQVHTARGNWP